MTRHSLFVATAIALTMSVSAGAQTTRFNDRVAPDTLGDAPGVSVWLEGSRTYNYGEPVRVRFSVDHDAYVIVARVDANGHLTVLYPANRSTSTLVSADREVLVRSRNGGSSASFYATDRWGGGYVFAMASYDPFDLSRLTIRDFDRYVTGTYVGRPSRMYIGDPFRVISRFASMVLYDESTPFDYAVDYYYVGFATYQTSSGFSNYCNDYGGHSYGYQSLQERWDDAMYYGSDGRSFGCSGIPCYIGGFVTYSNYGVGYPGCYNPQQVAQQPPVVNPPVPPRDTVRGPIVDSIVRTRPDTVGTRSGPGPTGPPSPPKANDANGGGVIVGGIRRAPLTGEDPEGGRVFSIPERALTNLRRRNAEALDPAPNSPDRPNLRSPVAGGETGVTWVRPPVEVTRGDGNGGMASGNLPHPARREGRGDNNFTPGARNNAEDRPLPPRRDEGIRYSEPTRNDPPPRANPTRFDSPPPSVHYTPNIRQDSPRSEPIRQEAPRQIERPAPPPPPPPAQSPPAKDPPPDKKP